MASKSTITRMDRIAKTVEKYREKRQKLKDAGDYAGLARLPRDASPTRLRNLCALTGRSRGVYRKLKISRIKLRDLALEGKIAGMKKASW
jgi:small subunit ribosomal protein S14